MSPSCSLARPIVFRRFVVACLLACLGTRAAGADVRDYARVPTQRMMVDDAGTDSAAAEKSAAPGGKSDPDEARKRRTAQSALFLVIGIAAVGLMLVLMVLLWGIRLRRRMKKRRRPSAEYDPLWYLRTRKTQPANPDTRAGETTDTNGT